MHLSRAYRARAAAAAAGIVLAAACTDRSNPAAPASGGGAGGPAAPGTPVPIATVACTGDVQKHTISCDAPVRLGDRAPRFLIMGGQNRYVTLTSSNPSYDSGTQAFTFDVTVRNLIPQALGTTDGVTLDPAGVRVLFAEGPTVTSGTGTITVTGDGTATFTAPNQPYYQYSQVLAQYQLSSPRTWQLNMPPTVGTFSFLLMVAAPVKYENGYIDVMGNANIRSGAVRTLTAVVRTPVGNVDSAATAITWTVSPSDQLLANYTREHSDTAVVHGYRAGAPVMNVTASRVNYSGATVTVSGSLTLNVQPTGRVWTGATNAVWETGSNWLPDSIAPTPSDTAIVPDTTSATHFPGLTANEAVGGVQVLDLTPGGVIPTVNLAAFDLTAGGDVLTTNSAAITSTSGALFLSGTGRTVAGTLPMTVVNGTYSLIGNISVRAPIRVDLGRITNTGFRMDARSF